MPLAQKPLAEGGEGKIYEIKGDLDNVAKVYTGPEKAERSHKLRAMTERVTPAILKIAAWPTSTLHERVGGPVVGFKMPRISGYREIHHLYSVTQRRSDFPNADFHFLLHAAKNCAIAFEAIHEQGHVIGDVNQKNVMVSGQALIRLVDCDSFQVNARDGTVFRCPVGVPEYTPPELHGKKFARLDRTVTHDRFGLAVLIFHLLMMGRHPFSGRYLGHGEMPLEKSIEESRFAYSKQSASYRMAPPVGTPPIEVVGPELVNLFEAAFAPPSVTNKLRPSATDWKEALGRFRQSLAKCSYFDNHFYSASLAACPWCNLQTTFGVLIFSIPPSAARFLAIAIDVDAIVAEVKGLWLKIPDSVYVRPIASTTHRGRPVPAHLTYPGSPPTFSIPSQPKAMPFHPPPMPAAPEKIPLPDFQLSKDDEFLMILSLVGAAAGFLLLFIAVPVGMICVGAFSAWYFGLMVTQHGRRRAARRRHDEGVKEIQDFNDENDRRHVEEYKESIRPLEERNRAINEARLRKIEAEFKKAQARYLALEEEWRRAGSAWYAELESRKNNKAGLDRRLIEGESRLLTAIEVCKPIAQTQFDSLSTCTDQLQATKRKHELELKQLGKNSEEFQRRAHLERHLIRDARSRIILLTPTRIANLSSFGIETAADIDQLSSVKVPDVGEVTIRKLREWRDHIAWNFRFDPKLAVPAAQRLMVDGRFQPQMRLLADSIKKGIIDFDTLVYGFHQERNTLISGIERLVEKISQAGADVTVMERMSGYEITWPSIASQ